MSELARPSVLASLPVPQAPAGISFRKAVLGDVGFIDQLQKMYGHQLGFLWHTALIGHVNKGNVIIADEPANRCQMGYLIAADRYRSQDHVCHVYQIAVVPMRHRQHVAAQMLQYFFNNLPYGSKLCGCWCAQDIQGNHFWENCGFVPIAFRAGSQRLDRLHIYWQKRVRAGDESTPWWFPFETNNGALQAGRVVLPIPPGVHWKDALPRILPTQAASAGGPRLLPNGLPDPADVQRLKRLGPATVKPVLSVAERAMQLKARSKHLVARQRGQLVIMSSKGVANPIPLPEDAYAVKKKPSAPRPKVDPAHAAASRELRDRYLDALPQDHFQSTGKYNLTRDLAACPSQLPPSASPLSSLLQPSSSSVLSLPSSSSADVQPPGLPSADAHSVPMENGGADAKSPSHSAQAIS